MNELVKSIVREWCRRTGWPEYIEPMFYRDHDGPTDTCGCDLYFKLLDAVPLRLP
jgi:hypothetical protein